ncbi:MAG: hypothetical protein J6U54_05900 [Clostridiales bacterium]|nr:hypothetical protein [Clostridiales bacterium]
MLKAIFKTLGVAIGLVVIPILLIVVGMALTIIGPLAGTLMIIFLPLIIAGVIIGYNSAKKDKSE